MVAAKVWGVSDPHLFHEFVSGLRGFTAAEFNKLFIEDWLSKVMPKDQVWLCGDLTGGGHILEALQLLSELPGEKHLMIGNHDAVFPAHRDSHLHASRSINGVRVMVSHFPYSGDHSEESRYDQWRLPDFGVPIIHGHTHSSEILSHSPNGTPQINIAWEAVGGLVTFDSLHGYLNV